MGRCSHDHWGPEADRRRVVVDGCPFGLCGPSAGSHPTATRCPERIVPGDAAAYRAHAVCRAKRGLNSGTHEVHPRPAEMAIEAGASGQDCCERRSVSTSSSRTWSRPTSSSSITSRLIAARPIVNRPMATAPNAAAPSANAPIAVGPRRPGHAHRAPSRAQAGDLSSWALFGSCRIESPAVEATTDLQSIAQRSPPVHQRALPATDVRGTVVRALRASPGPMSRLRPRGCPTWASSWSNADGPDCVDTGVPIAAHLLRWSPRSACAPRLARGAG